MIEFGNSYEERDRSNRGARIEELVSSLSSDDGMVRQSARQQLVEMGPPAVEPLRRLLRNPQTQLRWESAKAFVDLRSPEAAPELVYALEDDDSGVRWLAVEALIRLGKPGAVCLLNALMENPGSFPLREGAHAVLKGQEAIPSHRVNPILQALEQRDPLTGVQVAVYDALQEINDWPE